MAQAAAGLLWRSIAPERNRLSTKTCPAVSRKSKPQKDSE